MTLFIIGTLIGFFLGYAQCYFRIKNEAKPNER